MVEVQSNVFSFYVRITDKHHYNNFGESNDRKSK